MKKKLLYNVLILFVVYFLSSCGATAQAPLESDSLSLTDRMNEAVWHSASEDLSMHIATTPLFETEKSIFSKSIVFTPPEHSNFKDIYGTFFFEVPDADSVIFETQVALQNGSQALTFEVFIQDGSLFTQQASTLVTSESAREVLSVDLTAYKGKSIFLTLAAVAKDTEVLQSSIVWWNPIVLTP